MSRVVNFADPEFEPTDEELQELAHEAFVGVTDRRVAAEQRHRALIEKLRAEALARLAERPASDSP